MPWVRSHYRRPAGLGGAPGTVWIVLGVLAVLLLIYLITTR
jgi:hypothetical protein